MSENKEMTAAPVKDIKLTNNIFSGFQEFQVAQRMAQALSSSTIVPKDYQNNIGNCIIALEMANRLNTSPMMVMQNLYIVNGRPAWSSQYIVAMINSSKKYKTELQYDLQGSGMDMSCYAYAEDHNGHIVKGPTITMKMAEDEGWLSKSGSKWKTMPEVMIRYRAASFFGRLNCPDMIMGIYSTDEVIEIGPEAYREIDPAQQVAREIKENANATPIDIKVDEDTGEVIEPTEPEDQAEDPAPEENEQESPAPSPAEPQKKPKDKPPQTTTRNSNKSAAGSYTPVF